MLILLRIDKHITTNVKAAVCRERFPQINFWPQLYCENEAFVAPHLSRLQRDASTFEALLKTAHFLLIIPHELDRHCFSSHYSIGCLEWL